MDIVVQRILHFWAKGQHVMFRFTACRDAIGQGRTLGIAGILILGFFPLFTVAEEPKTTVSIQFDLEETFPNMTWEQSRMTACLLDDRSHLSEQLLAWQKESQAQLEPLVKDYMYTAELLTRLAVQGKGAEDREQALLSFREMERHIQGLLDGYAVQIDQLFQDQTLQRRQVEGQAVQQIAFHELPPGSYRVYVVLTFATTALQWFEAFTVKGGDTVLCTLTRENLNNPYWTDLNWWKFINLDFSKHH